MIVQPVTFLEIGIKIAAYLFLVINLFSFLRVNSCVTLAYLLQGDHVTFLNVYKGFIQSNKSSKWCHKNFINYHAMVSPNPTSVGSILDALFFFTLWHPGFFAIAFYMQRKVIEVREQLKRITQRLGIGLKSCEGDIQVTDCSLWLKIYSWAQRLQRHLFLNSSIFF